MNQVLKFIFSLTLVAVTSASCRQVELFEKNTVIPNQEWLSGYAAEGVFVVSDTNALYQLTVVLRHTDKYKYNNIWLNIGMQPPGDSMYFQKVDLKLGDDANGWFGIGMNDIWEVRKDLNIAPRRFVKPGNYKFRITQIMRDNPLPNVLSAGLRLEKTGELPQ